MRKWKQKSSNAINQDVLKNDAMMLFYRDASPKALDNLVELGLNILDPVQDNYNFVEQAILIDNFLLFQHCLKEYGVDPFLVHQSGKSIYQLADKHRESKPKYFKAIAENFPLPTYPKMPEIPKPQERRQSDTKKRKLRTTLDKKQTFKVIELANNGKIDTIISYLKDEKLDLNAIILGYDLPLIHFALKKSNFELVAALIRAGASLSSKNKDGMTVYECFREQQFKWPTDNLESLLTCYQLVYQSHYSQLSVLNNVFNQALSLHGLVEHELIPSTHKYNLTLPSDFQSEFFLNLSSNLLGKQYVKTNETRSANNQVATPTYFTHLAYGLLEVTEFKTIILFLTELWGDLDRRGKLYAVYLVKELMILDRNNVLEADYSVNSSKEFEAFTDLLFHESQMKSMEKLLIKVQKLKSIFTFDIKIYEKCLKTSSFLMLEEKKSKTASGEIKQDLEALAAHMYLQLDWIDLMYEMKNNKKSDTSMQIIKVLNQLAIYVTTQVLSASNCYQAAASFNFYLNVLNMILAESNKPRDFSIPYAIYQGLNNAQTKQLKQTKKILQRNDSLENLNVFFSASSNYQKLIKALSEQDVRPFGLFNRDRLIASQIDNIIERTLTLGKLNRDYLHNQPMQLLSLKLPNSRLASKIFAVDPDIDDETLDVMLQKLEPEIAINFSYAPSSDSSEDHTSSGKLPSVSPSSSRGTLSRSSVPSHQLFRSTHSKSQHNLYEDEQADELPSKHNSHLRSSHSLENVKSLPRKKRRERHDHRKVKSDLKDVIHFEPHIASAKL